MKNLVTVLAFLLFTTVSAFAQTVYSSDKGEKYHTADCRLSGNAEGMAVANAKKAGKKPCEMCKPDQVGKAKLKQCEGKTKEGVRCKRMTGNKNKKCYQHSTK
ncbi:MAG: hypothetical protein O9302_14370 [Cyclobacteriaceae bacterium]|jgi:hypothetical protein|nr:hypothetical protein [Cytophagales bacterium]MCZ8329248.1 hypothetical protein [Cyclobacteriaceae bacterium]